MRMERNFENRTQMNADETDVCGFLFSFGFSAGSTQYFNARKKIYPVDKERK